MQAMHKFGTDPDLEAEDSVALLAAPRIPRTSPWHAPWSTSTHSRQMLVVPAMLLVGLVMLGTYLWVDHAVHHHGSTVAPHRLSFTDAQEIVSLDNKETAKASQHEKKNNHTEHHKIEGTSKESQTSTQSGADAEVKLITKDRHSIVDKSDANTTAVLVVEDYEASKKSEQQISVKKGEWVFEKQQKSNWTYIYTKKEHGWVPNWVLNTTTNRNSTESGKKKIEQEIGAKTNHE